MFSEGLTARRRLEAMVTVMHPHPLHEVLRQQVGLDSYAIDGDATAIKESWDERPARARTPVTLTR